MKNKRILYISYDGMTDPLGQSQVIPYLIGLAGKGYEFMLISFEKKNNFKQGREHVAQLLAAHTIEWLPEVYTKNPPVLSTLMDLYKMRRKAAKLYKKSPYEVVHCRSYLPSLTGLYLKRKFGVKFIFDMRGFWADERVEGKLWNLKNPLYSRIYSYFKKQERVMLSEADYIVSLTEAAKKQINSWKLSSQQLPVEVIPCCVDITLFDPESHHRREELRKGLGIAENEFVLSYLGSIGTWYMLDEMLLFFKRLLVTIPHARFLFITSEDPRIIIKACSEIDLPLERIIITKATRQQVPEYLSLSSVSIFFIKPAYSKMASSPVKQGETLSMGIPVICNHSIGDTDGIIRDEGVGTIVKGFTERDFDDAIGHITGLTAIARDKIRNVAVKRFSLESGVEKYASIYASLLK